VAQDLFALCGPEFQRSTPAVVAAVKRWAGGDHAQGLSLCSWLQHRVPGLMGFAAAAGEGGGGEAGDAAAPARRVVAAMAEVGRTIRRYEFAQRYGGWVGEHAGELAKEVGAFQEAAEEVRGWQVAHTPPTCMQACSQLRCVAALVLVLYRPAPALMNYSNSIKSMPLRVSSWLLTCRPACLAAHPQVSKERYAEAVQVASELSASVLGALQEGYVFVMPTAPGPAPAVGAGGSSTQQLRDAGAFRETCGQLGALACLAGMPQVGPCMQPPLVARDTCDGK
jgi:hypothetical protein